MIRLQEQCLEGIDTLPGLQGALQNAIELEHATLPPYLYALYSLDQQKNSEIYGLIRSVVMEEMSHFGLACNILNAIGGSPAIDSPAFVPTYPGPLPCGVEGQLTVPLAPFSIDLVETVFMVIEEPEDPVALQADDAEGPTIGQFYDAIKAAIIAQGSAIFTGNPNLQVTNSDPLVTPVGSVDDASAAIDAVAGRRAGRARALLPLRRDLPRQKADQESEPAAPVCLRRPRHHVRRDRSATAGHEPEGVPVPGRLAGAAGERHVQCGLHDAAPGPAQYVQRDTGRPRHRR
jgi:hypothetical protein